MRISPFLTFDGRCRDAMTFYRDLLGGELQLMTFGEAPETCDETAGMADRIMYGQLTLGDQVLMACDPPPAWQRPVQGFSVALEVPEPAEAERLFAALSDGGEVTMAMEETFWARRFGTVTDRFGTPWMINCSKPQ